MRLHLGSHSTREIRPDGASSVCAVNLVQFGSLAENPGHWIKFVSLFQKSNKA
jgi:hypothetical protein